MNIRHSINVLLALLVGAIIGSYIDRYYLFGPHRTALDVGHFSSRLMENAAMLRDLKSNDTACVKKTLASAITFGLDNLESYRAYPGLDSQMLAHLETAAIFSKDVLRANEKIPVEAFGPCSENRLNDVPQSSGTPR
jgi:hypothetical protein